MAYDKVVDSAKLDAALTATADAIRAKGGSEDEIEWNETAGFAGAVSEIKASEGPDTSLKMVYAENSADNYVQFKYGSYFNTEYFPYYDEIRIDVEIPETNETLYLFGAEGSWGDGAGCTLWITGRTIYFKQIPETSNVPNGLVSMTVDHSMAGRWYIVYGYAEIQFFRGGKNGELAFTLPTQDKWPDYATAYSSLFIGSASNLNDEPIGFAPGLRVHRVAIYNWAEEYLAREFIPGVGADRETICMLEIENNSYWPYPITINE